MKAQKTSRLSVPPAPAPILPPTREQIQALAHAIWLDRGRPESCDVEIWLEAERQLCGKNTVIPPTLNVSSESVDPDTAEAGRIERELDRIVNPPEQRSPTSL
jgi:hypothetical protein